MKTIFFWTNGIARLLFAVALLMNDSAFAQDLIRDRISVKKTLTLRGNSADSLLNDTSNMTGNKTLLTANAIRQYVSSYKTVAPTGQLLFGSGNSFGSSGNLFWDNSNGQLGIGTNSPSAKIETSTNTGSFPGGYCNNLKLTSRYYPSIWLHRTEDLKGFQMAVDANGYNVVETASGTGTSRFVVKYGGNVGIGTTNPIAKLNVVGSGATLFRLENSATEANNSAAVDLVSNGVNNNASVRYYEGATFRWELGKTGANDFALYNAATSNYAWSITRATSDFILRGKLGLGGVSPTHAITLPSSSTGIALYNTADNATSYERGVLSMVNNELRLMTESAGTGIPRIIRINQATFQPGGNNPGISTPTFSATCINPVGIGVTQYYGNTTVNNQSSGNIISKHFIDNVTQSGTAGFTSFRFSTYLGSVGSGSKNLFEVGTNSNPGGGGTFSPILAINANRNLGIGTASPTHPLTLSSGAMVDSGGIALYSTKDQTENYQRLAIKGAAGNAWEFDVQKKGTGATGYYDFKINGTSKLSIDNASSAFNGNILFMQDGTYSIGRVSSSPYRPASIYVTNAFQAGLPANTNAAARVHLGAGTTALPQIRLEDGVAPTAPNAGDIYRIGNLSTFHMGAKFKGKSYIDSALTITGASTSGYEYVFEALNSASSSLFKLRNDGVAFLGSGNTLSQFIVNSTDSRSGIFSKNYGSSTDNIIQYKDFSGVTKMTLDMSTDTGKLGIGIATPLDILHLKGTSRIENVEGTQSYTTAIPTVNRYRIKQNANGLNYFNFELQPYNSNQSGTFFITQRTNNAETGRFIFGVEGDKGNAIVAETGHLGFRFGTYPAKETVRFTSDGKVGIGTNAPTANLDVFGNIRQVSNNNFILRPASAVNAFMGLQFQRATDGSEIGGVKMNENTGEMRIGGYDPNYYFSLYAGNKEALRGATNGYIGINTVPTHPLTLGATAMATNGGIALYSTADQSTNYQRLNVKLNSSNIAAFDLQNGGSGTQPGYFSFRVNGTPVFEADALAAYAKGLLSVADNTYDLGRLSSNPYRYRSMYLGTSAQIGVSANTTIAARMHLGGSTTLLPQIRLEDGVAPTAPKAGDIYRVGNLSVLHTSAKFKGKLYVDSVSTGIAGTDSFLVRTSTGEVRKISPSYYSPVTAVTALKDSLSALRTKLNQMNESESSGNYTATLSNYSSVSTASYVYGSYIKKNGINNVVLLLTVTPDSLGVATSVRVTLPNAPINNNSFVGFGSASTTTSSVDAIATHQSGNIAEVRFVPNSVSKHTIRLVIQYNSAQ